MVLNRGAALLMPWSTKWLIDHVLIAREIRSLQIIVGLLVVAFVVQVSSRFGLDQLFGRASHITIAETRVRLMRRVLRMPLSFHDTTMAGTTAMRVMGDIEGIRSIIGSNVVEFAGSLIMA